MIYKIALNNMFFDCGAIDLTLLNDKEDDERGESLDFHVKANDYFANLATILDILKQEIMREKQSQNKLIDGLVNDLLYFQKNYKIKKRKRK